MFAVNETGPRTIFTPWDCELRLRVFFLQLRSDLIGPVVVRPLMPGNGMTLRAR